MTKSDQDENPKCKHDKRKSRRNQEKEQRIFRVTKKVISMPIYLDEKIIEEISLLFTNFILFDDINKY